MTLYLLISALVFSFSDKIRGRAAAISSSRVAFCPTSDLGSQRRLKSTLHVRHEAALFSISSVPPEFSGTM